ncbi:MAG: PBP1A family penicillin-binding protein [Verrucomicrobiaceae bacterium]|nr:PBP1A family penicillin-binding protein [Verrucomicrobiaceae bacterium]
MPAPKKKRKKDDTAPHDYEKEPGWWKRVLVRVVIGVPVLCILAGAVVIAVYSQLAKGYPLDKLGEMPQRTFVYDAKGQVLGQMHGENRIVVPLDQVSPWFVKALLVREDARFYEHGGIDFVGVVRAMVRNLKDGRIVQGASTITMQLARNSYPDLDDRSFHRKLLEMMLARRIEKTSTKEQILDHYVNRIFFGNSLYGIQRASQVYFGKHASQLTLGESALIAGIIRGPTRFSPFKNFESALHERDVVLSRMVQMKVITEEEALAARYEDIALHAQPVFTPQGGYALDLVKRDLDLILESQEIEDGGLQVYTTLDLDLQKTAEEALEKRIRGIEKLRGFAHPTKAAIDAKWDGRSEMKSTDYLQGAVTVINNDTGGIVAIVGGRDYRQSKYNRAAQGERQIGSTVKPFVYAAAIGRGLLPGSLIEDAPLRPGEIEGAASGWNPGNSDGKFIGWQPMVTGLVQSRNTMTIRIGNYAGLDRVLQLLGDAGIGQGAKRTPQVFIGNLGANLKQLTSAFSIYPNQGVRRRPFLIDRIIDRSGHIIYTTPVLETEAVSPGVSHLVRRMLSEVIDKGTAATLRSEFKYKEPGGGKTGTTNDYKDAWFCGYSDKLTCGVWLGLDQPKTIIEEGYAGKLAVPIWADVMNASLKLGYKPQSSRANEVPLTNVSLCRVSSRLANEACRQQETAYQDDIPYELVPDVFCEVHGNGTAVAQGTSSPRPPQKRTLLDRIRGWFR